VTILRGLPFQLGRIYLYREVQRLPGVRLPPDMLGSLCHPAQRYDALCWAALLAQESGEMIQARALLGRIPALNLLLRPEAALLVADEAVTSGELPALIAGWQRALRFVFQEGRLDIVLEQLAARANDQGNPSLAASLTSYVGAGVPTCPLPVQWHK